MCNIVSCIVNTKSRKIHWLTAPHYSCVSLWILPHKDVKNHVCIGERSMCYIRTFNFDICFSGCHRRHTRWNLCKGERSNSWPVRANYLGPSTRQIVMSGKLLGYSMEKFFGWILSLTIFCCESSWLGFVITESSSDWISSVTRAKGIWF